MISAGERSISIRGFQSRDPQITDFISKIAKLDGTEEGDLVVTQSEVAAYMAYKNNLIDSQVPMGSPSFVRMWAQMDPKDKTDVENKADTLFENISVIVRNPSPPLEKTVFGIMGPLLAGLVVAAMGFGIVGGLIVFAATALPYNLKR